jgi:hypothetical protein
MYENIYIYTPMDSNGILMRHGSNSKNIPMKLLNVNKLKTHGSRFS